MGLTQAGTDGLKDNAVSLAKMAGGTDGQIITYDASGNPTAVGPGTDGQVLTSTGAGSPPAFEDAAGGTALTGSTNNTITTVTGANAIQGEANLTFDGSKLNVGGTAVAQTRTVNIGSDSEANLAIETHNDATSESANIRLFKSGNTAASPQVVETDDNIGSIAAYGYDGTDYNNAAAKITFAVDGAPGSNDMPGKIGLWTTADGATSPTERMRIDSAGNVGIGVTPDNIGSYHTLHIKGPSGEGAGIRLQDNGDTADSHDFQIYKNASAAYLRVNGTDPLISYCNGAERMRVRSDGNILIAMQDFASTPSSSNYGIALNNTNAASVWAAGSATTNTHIIWANTNGTCGTIQTEGTGTSYNTSSDYRLKENIVGITDGITRLKQLAPKRFNFKTNASKVLDGFLAHEVTPIVPEAVSGAKDAVEPEDNADKGIKKGDIIPQGIDQAKLVPLLTAALQEAIAKIEALETKVAALEAG